MNLNHMIALKSLESNLTCNLNILIGSTKKKSANQIYDLLNYTK